MAHALDIKNHLNVFCLSFSLLVFPRLLGEMVDWIRSKKHEAIEQIEGESTT